MSYAPYPPPRRVARVAFEAPPSIAVDGDFGVALHTAPVLGDIGFTVVGLVDVLNLNTMSGPDASILGKLELTAPARPADDRKLVEGETGHSGPGGHEFEPWGVALKGHYAYVTTQDSLRVIDIFKVDDVGGLGGLGAAGGIVVTGGHAYVADRLGGLRVIDITRPAMPRLVETLPPGDAIGVAAFDGGLAVLDASGGLSLFRIERPGQLELVSRIEPSNINTVSTHATHIAASGHSVFLAGPGFVWATSTDAPTNSTYFEDFDFLSNIQSIAAVDGLLYVNDRRSGMLVFDHVTAPYWAMVAITVHEPPDRGAATATPPPAADASSGGDAADAAATDGSETTEDDLGYISGPITSFKIGSDEDAYRSVWLDGPAEALARLGRTVFLEPVDVTRGERIFRFAGRRAMLLPPGVRPVDGPDDAEVEVEFNWAPNDKEQAAFATEIAGTVPTRTPIPGLPRPRPTATPPPIVVPDFSTLRGP